MKIFKKLLPLLVIVTILLSVAIIPSSASNEVSAYEGRWYYMEDIDVFETTTLIQGEFLLFSYDYDGSGYLFDYSHYRTFKSIYFNNGIVQGALTNGSVQTLSSGSTIIPYNRFIFVKSLNGNYNTDFNSNVFTWLDNMSICETFNLDGMTIPFIGGDTFDEMRPYIPNIQTFGGDVFFERSYGNASYVYGNGDELVTSMSEPFEYGFNLTTTPSSEGNILTGFGSVTTWITTALGSLDVIFFANGALTPLGIICIIGLSLGLAFLLFNVVKNFLKLRS